MAVRFSVPKNRLKALREAVRELNADTTAANRAAHKRLYRHIAMRIPKLQTIGISPTETRTLISVEIRIADRAKVLWQQLTGVMNKFGA